MREMMFLVLVVMVKTCMAVELTKMRLARSVAGKNILVTNILYRLTQARAVLLLNHSGVQRSSAASLSR